MSVVRAGRCGDAESEVAERMVVEIGYGVWGWVDGIGRLVNGGREFGVGIVR